MALIETTLFETIDKVKMAIERLKDFEPEEGYYLAFSGGKDSIVLKALADMANVKYDAHYNVTGIDPPELTRFIKRHYPDVEWHMPVDNIFKLMIKKRYPPTRIARWCCDYLKEGRGTGHRDRNRTILTGIRWAESVRRKNNRRMYEVCYKDKTKMYLHPMIDWEAEDIWEFIKQENLPYCKLYDEGYKRLGCIMCPQAGSKKVREEAAKYPKFAKRWQRAFKELWELREKEGNPFTDWKSWEEMYEWWLNGGWGKRDENQECFRFDN